MLLDRVVERRTAVDAAELVSAGAEARDGGALLAAGGVYEIPVKPGELDGIDCLEVGFDKTAAAAGEFALGFEMSTGRRTPGLARNDGYHIWNQRSGHAEGGRMVLPYENFCMIGYPTGWGEVERLVITVREGTGLVRGIEAVVRERSPGPRLTDEEFFGERLDCSVAGMQHVKAAAEGCDYAAAAAELVVHLRSRSAPVLRYRSEPEPVDGHSTEAADRILAHFINGHQLGKEIDWRANPEGYLEWCHAFNRHRFLMTLVDAYLATGDGRYAAELDYLVSTWIKASPCPIANNGGGDPAWETLSTACRVAYVWMQVFFGVLNAKEFSDRTRIDMLKSLHAHAEHLVRYQGFDNNWRIAEAQAVLTAGICFPEMSRSVEWVRTGSERLLEEMARQVWPDGVQQEVSPGYHWMCGRAFAAMRGFYRDNARELPGGFEETVAKMAEYVMYLTRPDGSTPSFNDSGGVRGRRGLSEAVRYGAEELGREDMRYVLSRGRAGSPPEALFTGFPDAGIFVSRSDWSERANWLAFRAGRTGRAHCHEDKLSFELAALGDLIIVDPGIASYQNEPWTHFFRSAAAHNVAFVDGLAPNQIGRLSREQKMASSRSDVISASGEVLDYASGLFCDGWGAEPEGLDGITHRREIVFIRPAYWAVLDSFFRTDGEGGGGEGDGGSHEVELLFHFMPMRVGADAGGIVRTNRLGRPNLDLIPAWPAEPAVEIICGQSDPVQGWIAADGIVPAPVASMSTSGQLPLRLATVLVPHDSSGDSGMSAARTDVPGGVDLEIAHPVGGRDILMWRPETVAAGGPAATDAGLALLRLGAKGEVLSAAAVGGSFVHYEGVPVVEATGAAGEVDYAETVGAD